MDLTTCKVIQRASSALLIIITAGCVEQPRTHFQAVQSAARKGNARSEYELAHCYARGNGVPQDYVKAAECLRKSANQGYAYAQTDLGSFYARGLGVQQDYSESLRWYRKAAAQGDSLAQYCLGYAYAHGSGVPKDFEQAVSWWQKSVGRGQVEAENALGQFYFHGEDPGDTNHVNYAASAKWLRKAAEQNFVGAMNNLAFIYQYGWSVQKDLQEALKWYRRAAQKGDAMAQANLGLMYQDGVGVSRDMVQAYKWFTLSAGQGNPVGRRYFDEYNEKHLLTPQQFGQAKQMAAEFHAQMQTNRHAGTPELQTESGR